MVIDFSPFYDFHTGLDRILDELGGPHAARRRAAYPPLNISEDDKALHVHVETPGVPMEDLEITLKDKSLSIKGERKAEGGAYFRQERPAGPFQRLVSLGGASIDTEAVTATLKDGVLHITLPKSDPDAGRKTISINS